jgi:hypothetical protein
MNWTHYLLAVVLSGIAASFTDWLFMGVLFHDKYLAYPEVWRGKPGQPDASRILISTLLGFVSCAAFVYLCWLTDMVTAKSALTLAVVVWLAGPLPLIRTNIAWIKMHPLLGVSHSMGWLARFVVTALITVWLF